MPWRMCLGRDVVLQAEKIVTCPFFRSVRAGGLFFDDRERVLKADRIREPKAAALDGTGERESRIPVAEMSAFLNVDAGDGIGGAKAPAVVAVGSFQAENAGAGMSVGGSDAARLDFRGAGSVDVEARGQRAVGGIANFKAVEEILRIRGARAGDVQVVEIVLHDFAAARPGFAAGRGCSGRECRECRAR